MPADPDLRHDRQPEPPQPRRYEALESRIRPRQSLRAETAGRRAAEAVFASPRVRRSPCRSADSQIARASFDGRHCATAHSTFSIGSTRASGCRGTAVSPQCTCASAAAHTARVRRRADVQLRCHSASTHSPSRRAWVTHVRTTPARWPRRRERDRHPAPRPSPSVRGRGPAAIDRCANVVGADTHSASDFANANHSASDRRSDDGSTDGSATSIDVHWPRRVFAGPDDWSTTGLTFCGYGGVN